MFFLTRREQLVIIGILCAFLIGLGVKHYRAMQSIKPKNVHGNRESVFKPALARICHPDSSLGAAQPDLDKEETALRRRFCVYYRL